MRWRVLPFFLVASLAWATDQSHDRVRVRLLGSTKLRHGWLTGWVGFSADGRTLLSHNVDGQLRRWSVRDGSPSGDTTEVHGQPVSSIDGRLLVLPGRDDAPALLLDERGAARPLKLPLGRSTPGSRRRTSRPTSAGEPLAIDADGSRIACTSAGGTVEVLDLESGRPVWTARDPDLDWFEATMLSPCRAAAFGDRGALLATVGRDNDVDVFDARSGKRLWRLVRKGPPPAAVAFAGASRQVLFATKAGAFLWHPEAPGTPRSLVSEESPGATDAAFVASSRDGRRAAFSFSSDRVFVYDLEHMRVVSTILPRRGGASLMNPAPYLAFSSDGSLLAIADGNATVRLWDVVAGKDRIVPGGHLDTVSAFACDQSATTVVSVDGHQHAIVWEGATGRAVRELKGVAPAAIALTGAGDLLAFADLDGRVHVQERASGRERWSARPAVSPPQPISDDRRWRTRWPQDEPGAKAAPEKTKLANQLLNFLLSRAQDALHESQHEAVEKGVCALAFSPDGGMLASAGPGRAVLLWNAQSGELARRLDCPQPPQRLAFSPGGRLLFAGSTEGALAVWDASGGRLMRTLGAPGDEDYAGVADIRVSSDGERVAWVSECGTVSVAAIGTGRLLRRKHFDATGVAAIAPDCDSVAFSTERGIELGSLLGRHAQEPLTGAAPNTMGLRFTADGAHLVASRMDGLLAIHVLGTQR